jgi:hypothetical protein
MPLYTAAHYDRLFERFAARPITRHWGSITIRQNSSGLFCLEDVLAVCGIERTDLMIERLRGRLCGEFAKTFDGRQWHYWASLPAILSIAAVPDWLGDRLKVWQDDRFGVIDRIC